MSHNLLLFSLRKTSEETTFSVFLSFFLVKLSNSRSLKLNISRTAWPILMILVSFCRILNGLSDESNLFWHCSSPLNFMDMYFLASFVVGLHRNGDRYQYFSVRYHTCHGLKFKVLLSRFCSLAAIPIVTVTKVCNYT